MEGKNGKTWPDILHDIWNSKTGKICLIIIAPLALTAIVLYYWPKAPEKEPNKEGTTKETHTQANLPNPTPPVVAKPPVTQVTPKHTPESKITTVKTITVNGTVYDAESNEPLDSVEVCFGNECLLAIHGRYKMKLNTDGSGTEKINFRRKGYKADWCPVGPVQDIKLTPL